MKSLSPVLAAILIAWGVGSSHAHEPDRALPTVLAPRAGDLPGDVPAGVAANPYLRSSGDTLCFGYVDDDGFAVPGEVWTFDHGEGSLEGWYGLDVTAQTGLFFRQITDEIWLADPANLVDAPVLSGAGSAWIGLFAGEANALCWDAGLGYGNQWCQRLVSPTQTYSGAGSVSISWLHFNDTEPDYDYSRVYLRLPERKEIELAVYDGEVGLAPDHPMSPPVGVTDGVVLSETDFDGAEEYQIVFEMSSDPGWSDEDGYFTTEYGPAAYDDVRMGAAPEDPPTYDFETDLDGWLTEACPGFGTFLGIADISDYLVEDACQCDLAGNVLEMHRGVGNDGDHPYGQRSEAISPVVDVLNDVTQSSLPGEGQISIIATWDQYSEMPRANGVAYRPGAYYYPYICELTGESGWSPRVGQRVWYFVGENPSCDPRANILTEVDVPVPRDVEQLRFVFEVLTTCDGFGIPPEECAEETNFTPLIDNVRLCFTRVPDAPAFSIDLGGRFQDGFAQSTSINDVTRPGRADVTSNVNFGDIPPIVLGDSLTVRGPVVTSDPATSWESHFWFRVARRGPRVEAAYTTWRNQVLAATGVDIESGEFARASMDSLQHGLVPLKNRFATYLKEGDWVAWGRPASGPELSEAVEIIPDNVLWPGTQIEYFLTANYTAPERGVFFLPDTIGGNFLEFEILPGWEETEGGHLRHPCFLYIDAYNRGAGPFIEGALDALGVARDRYDYLDSTASWTAPMARGPGVSNNGCTLPQLLGYRGILVSSGSLNTSGLMRPIDYVMLSDWLSGTVCDVNYIRRGMILNGDGITAPIAERATAFLAQLGVERIDGWYADLSGNHDTCVRIEERLDAEELYGTENSISDYEYDAYGNWCPRQYQFDVLGTVGSGVGNRVYLDLDELTETAFAQVVNKHLVPNGSGGYLQNYRTVVDGVSWHHLAAPESGGLDRCVASEGNIETAAFNEIAAAIEWIYEVDYGQFAGLCEDQCAEIVTTGLDPNVLGDRSTALLQNQPNPFNPRTTIRLRLATSGPVELVVFDVSGRRIRTLIDGSMEAGEQGVTWDGLDDAGRRVGSGVYWYQLTTLGHTYNRKATVLR